MEFLTVEKAVLVRDHGVEIVDVGEEVGDAAHPIVSRGGMGEAGGGALAEGSVQRRDYGVEDERSENWAERASLR